MKSPPLTQQERSYIEAHKNDAEAALRGLIQDIKLARIHLAANLVVFHDIALFLEEALAERDDQKLRELVRGTMNLAENYSIPLQGVYMEIGKTSVFDPLDSTQRGKRKIRSQRTMTQVE